MTGPLVIEDDIELFLTAYIRREIRRVDYLAKYPVLQGFVVSNREPGDDEPFPAKLIVVRNDGATPTDILTSTTSVAINVLMASVEDLYPAGQAARVVHAIVRGCAEPGAGTLVDDNDDPIPNPVSAVNSSLGPYTVPESQPRARLYSTHELATVGHAL